MKQGTSQELYKQAHDNHYKSKNIRRAYALYALVISEYPDSEEAIYATQQMNNIKALPSFDETYSTNLAEVEQTIKEEELKITQKEKDLEERLSAARKSDIFLITSGFNFEGYRIRQYLEVLAGESVLGTGFLSELSSSFSDFFGVESDKFADKLSKARDSATQKLISKAKMLAANAIIGLDYDYVTFGQNVVGVIANGTAVFIEPM